MSDSPWGPPPPRQDPAGPPQSPNPYAAPAGDVAPPQGGPYGATAHGATAHGGVGQGGPAPDPDRRPATVTAAAVITFVCAGTSALLLGLTAIGLVVAREALGEEITRQVEADPALRDLDVPDAGELTALLAVVMGVVALWCLVACVLAFLAMRRSNIGRVLLVVSAAVSALLSLLLILSFVTVVTLVASVAVIALLFAGGASDWYARRTPMDGHPPTTPH